MKAVKQIIVKEKDIDVSGHVNNSIYLKFLEQGRQAWYIKYAGYTYADFKKENLGTFVVNINITYKKEVVLDDILDVVAIPKRLGHKSFEFDQYIINQHGDVVTEATVTKVMMDIVTRKSRPVIDGIARGFREALVEG